MIKQKKSFLDRIMGSDSKETEREESVSNVQKNSNEVLNNAPKSESIEEKIMEKDAVNFSGKNEIIQTNNKSREWLEENSDGGEEEGQLTVDVYQADNFIIVKSIIGGVRSGDLDVSVTNDMVTIKGKRNNPDMVKTENYYYQECFWGNFSRSIILPCDVRAENVEATMKNGVLTLKLPKIEKNSSMKVMVKEE